ncbi:orotidine-5'-phosphate decarboxylase [Polynucleobacter sp. Latsch14-2]|jgi:orotidine-5'-phosphate decarboxylase|uniref:orotidine-5'-phosphate decarboxylase n=1 Tax=Polynucleobacter sp. Latsch14-2 TaxID=2576920 RepID=UPI001C0BF060|nr:orotidine-5'-phosphate decarboxylase [Polynucleobacter sp. Latsch14-2]MBU3613781.1 orotidine-5'-phosphate decarboxylase [Polynucleobacter sp. Latsch14-2]
MNTSQNTFTQQLQSAWASQGSMLCVGLDPDPKRLPSSLQGKSEGIFEFCREIADATADLACSFKPQFAYFASQGAEAQLEKLIGYLKNKHPKIPVILDSKRGDIGSTAEQYALEAFERYGADAVTVNPYMGFDSIEPYLRHTGKGVIVLCRTSNPGGSDLQFLNISPSGEPLYLHVAKLAAQKWNASGQISLVVGATFPEEIAKVREIVGEMPLLIPGIGAQGGDIDATVKAGSIANKLGTGMMINSSRAILYASSGTDFAEAARKVALSTRDALRTAAEK